MGEGSFSLKSLRSRKRTIWGLQVCKPAFLPPQSTDRLPQWLISKESTCDAVDERDAGLIPGLGRPPGEGMATHSSILDWRIPWTEEPSRLQSTVLQRVRQLKRLSTHTHRHQAGVPQHPGVFLPLSGCGFLCSEHLFILSLPGEKKSLQLWEKKYVWSPAMCQILCWAISSMLFHFILCGRYEKQYRRPSKTEK